MSSMRSALCALAITIALPVSAMAAPPEIPAPKSYLAWTVTLDKNTGMVVAMVPQQIGGKIAVCGAIWPLNKSMQTVNSRDRVFREALVEMKKKQVRVNLNVFAVHDSEKDAKTFRCSISNRPWEGNYKPDDFSVRMRTSRIVD